MSGISSFSKLVILAVVVLLILERFNIVEGSSSLSGEFPFMAALGWIENLGELKYYAGGMVISPKFILTAAHCVYNDGEIPDTVFIGGQSLTLQNNDLLKHSIANVTIFPKYDPNQGYDDIAIIELTKPTEFSAVCLWFDKNLPSNDVTAIGYGLTEFAGMGSQELLKVNLTVFSNDYCEQFFEDEREFDMGLSDALICAGDKEGLKDTCQGDSGGPLIYRHKNQMFAVGITSSGQACSGFPPAIYTKIYPYTEWISNVLKERGQYLKTCNIKN
ncbi:serine protease snake-like isoform X2 [Eupeodes corollae]|uniref:serine protease snake-like isoform X2 n=1 Tax=Eupeodes corollae TaxID=290404 RepID=UPI002490C3E1|nr:serine protease snake-like isoform X2 [Eupeodes corollae]